MPKIKFKSLCVLLTALILFSLTPFTVTAEEDYASREYVIHSFLNIVDREEIPDADTYLDGFSDRESISDYAVESMAKAVKSNIVFGYEDGTLRPQNNIMRAEAMVLLARSLPKDLEDQRDEIAFTDVPEWAKEDIAYLTRLGLLAGYGNGMFGAYDNITLEQVSFLEARLLFFYPVEIPEISIPEGFKPEDDFYRYVNQDWLKDTTLGDYEYMISPATKTDDDIYEKMIHILMNIVDDRDQYTRTSPQGKIADYFIMANMMDTRDKAGLRYFKEIIRGINKMETIKGLPDVLTYLEVNYANESFFVIDAVPGGQDSSKYEAALVGASLGLDRSMYLDDVSEDITKEYIEFMRFLLTVSGMSEAEATEMSEAVYSLEKEMALSMLTIEQMYDPEITNNVMTLDEIRKILKNFDFKAYLDEVNYNVKKITVYDKNLLSTVNRLLTDDNLEAIKAYLIVNVLRQYSNDLTREIRDASRKLSRAIYGMGESSLDEKDVDFNTALQNTFGMFGTELSDMYAKQYLDEETLNSVEDMTKELIAAFKTRISNNDWLSESAKVKAAEKLDAIIPLIGYNKEDDFDAFQFFDIDYNDRHDYLKHKLDIITFYNANNKYAIGKEVTREVFMLSASDVNAAYSPSRNTIMIPAGIINAPFYDKDAPYEENLGALGSVIAHELTHALDNTGSKYDKTGAFKNWWSTQDRKSFNALAKRVEARFSSFIADNGQRVNGTQTLSENISDLGALQVVTSLASEKGLDLKKVYAAYAAMRRAIYSDGYLTLLLSTDTHSPNVFRVNGVLPNIDEFIELYDINEGDGMYLPKEDRIVIW